jgi:hypothetical protein
LSSSETRGRFALLISNVAGARPARATVIDYDEGESAELKGGES